MKHHQNLLLLIAVVLLAALPLWLVPKPAPDAEGKAVEIFAGADNKAKDLIGEIAPATAVVPTYSRTSQRRDFLAVVRPAGRAGRRLHRLLPWRFGDSRKIAARAWRKKWPANRKSKSVLIEQSAYSNRWRCVSPAAKGLFATCGFVAIFAAKSPLTATFIAGLLLAVTLIGAGITPTRYLRVAAPALFFLAMGSLSLAFAVDVDGGRPLLHMAPSGLSKLAEVGTRSLGALAALLFLVLTTPLVDLISPAPSPQNTRVAAGNHGPLLPHALCFFRCRA
jgi:hypothetical protein